MNLLRWFAERLFSEQPERRANDGKGDGSKYAVIVRNVLSKSKQSAEDIEDDAPAHVIFERKVADSLRQVVEREGGKVFSNLYIPYGNGMTEIDHVVLLRDRLLVVECKAFHGVIYCNYDMGGNWVQFFVNHCEGHSYPFYSPVAQNATHIRALAAVLGVPAFVCKSLVVFADTAQLRKVPKHMGCSVVCNLCELKESVNTLHCSSGQKLHFERMEQLLSGYALSDSELRAKQVSYAKAQRAKSQRTG